MSTEGQVNTLAEYARQAILNGDRDSAITYVTEAIGLMAEQAGIDATPLIDLLEEVLK